MTTAEPQKSGRPDEPQPTAPGWGEPAPGWSDPWGAAYPPPPGYPYPVVLTRPTNGLAIASLVCAVAGVATCVSAPVGAILGHVARRQIRERGENGDGLALAGIIVGWILTGLLLAYLVAMAVLFGLGAAGYLD
jgi:hypothetical protein